MCIAFQKVFIIDVMLCLAVNIPTTGVTSFYSVIHKCSLVNVNDLLTYTQHLPSVDDVRVHNTAA